MNMYDEVSRRILFVDDEKNVLSGFNRRFNKIFDIETALGGKKGLQLMTKSGPFAVVVSDLRMQEMDGLAFLRQVHRLSPDTVCIMLTGFADLDVAVDAVNEGHIFRFLTKPCPSETLLETLNEGLEQYRRLMVTTRYTYTTHVKNSEPAWTHRSTGCLSVTGYTAQDFLKDSDLWFSIVLPEHQAMVRANIDAVIAGSEVGPIEFKIRTRDGNIRWIRDTIIPHSDENGAVHKYDGLVEDVTERREIAEALQRSEARYQRMVANIPGIVYQFISRTDGTIDFRFLSDSCKQLFSLDPDRIKADGSILFDKIHPDDLAEFYRLIDNSTRRLAPCDWWGRVNVAGEQKWFQSVLRPEQLENGDILWDGVILDITEAKKAEAELIKTNLILKEHDRLKSEFVSTVSHELRTPLCIFKNIVSNAMAGVMGKVNHKLYKSLKTADASIDRLSRIIADFLDISRIESGVMKLDLQLLSICPLVSEVTDSLRTLATAKGLDLNTDLCGQELLVNADKDRIAQVLTNLVGNAIKFIPTNCRIDVVVADRTDHVEVAVRDNGPGLSKEDMEKIFDRFVQVRNPADAGEHGTGLGLTIAKELVQMHKGRISVESTPGHGCCFCFTLPKYNPSNDNPADTEQLVTADSESDAM
jgi:PAS domain S-box-containing protein